MQKLVLRPPLRLWALLFFPLGLIIFLGISSLLAGDFLVGVALLGVSVVVLGYNATSRLELAEKGVLKFYRYGMELWSTESKNLVVTSGFGGKSNIFPTYIFEDHNAVKKSLIKTLYTKQQWQDIFTALVQQGAIVDKF